MLHVMEQELPSAPDTAKVDNMELQEIMEKATKSMENLIVQSEELPHGKLELHKVLGLDKQLRSIRGSLKVETTKKV